MKQLGKTLLDPPAVATKPGGRWQRQSGQGTDTAARMPPTSPSTDAAKRPKTEEAALRAVEANIANAWEHAGDDPDMEDV